MEGFLRLILIILLANIAWTDLKYRSIPSYRLHCLVFAAAGLAWCRTGSDLFVDDTAGQILNIEAAYFFLRKFLLQASLSLVPFGLSFHISQKAAIGSGDLICVFAGCFLYSWLQTWEFLVWAILLALILEQIQNLFDTTALHSGKPKSLPYREGKASAPLATGYCFVWLKQLLFP